MKRNFLTVQDLLKFCQEQKMYSFSSKDTKNGERIVVQAIQDFSDKDVEIERIDGRAYFPVKVSHLGLNRNGSFCSEESAKKAMPSLKYAPFLANIHQLDDGTWDFHSHDGHMEYDEDGNETDWVYDEKQIGTFTADEPYLYYDEEMDKTYVVARVAIPEDYTKAVEIIERKKGTKVSCELAIDEMKYNAKEGYLDLVDWTYMGVTALGSEKNGKEVGEGMLGSKLSLSDFSEKNNSIVKFNELNNRLENMESKLDTLISQFDNKNYGKEENEVAKEFEEVVETTESTEVTESVEVDNAKIDVDTDETVETVVENNEVDNAENADETIVEENATEESEVVEENSEDTEEVIEENSEEIVEENSEIEAESEVVEENSESESEESDDVIVEENNVEESEAEEVEDAEVAMSYHFNVNVNGKEFEVSLDEKIYALNDLVNITYGESDNTWYGCTVYESYLVMHDYWNNRHYKQTYSQEEDAFALTGDRVQVYAEYCTSEELESLKEMRSNYSSIFAELQKYKDAESYADKMTVFEDESYAQFLETAEFAELMKKENVDKYSKDELVKECELAFAKLVKANRTFSFDDSKATKSVKKRNKMSLISDFEFADDNNKSEYGDYFKSINASKNK